MCHKHGNVLVEGVENDFADAVITPRPMHEKEFSKVTKLTNGNVGASSGLQTLDTCYTDTNMSSLDHGNVVGAVTDGE